MVFCLWLCAAPQALHFWTQSPQSIRKVRKESLWTPVFTHQQKF